MDEDAGPAAEDDIPDDDAVGEDAVDDDATAHDTEGDPSPEADPTSDDDEDESRGSVAGTLAYDLPIEPEDIDLWNVVFVVLGAYVGLLVIAAVVASMMDPQGGLAGVEIAWLTLGFGVVAGLTYAIFARTSAEALRGNPDT